MSLKSLPQPSVGLFGGCPNSSGIEFPEDLPLTSPDAHRRVKSTLASGRWSMFTSDEISRFEREFADFVGARDTVLVNSCTTAILSCLLAFDVLPNEYVVVPNYTYIGSCMPLLTVGAIPVLVDIDPSTQGIDLASLKKAFAKYSIRAVIHPHLFGKASRCEEVFQLCQKNGARYISDSAQHLGNSEVSSALATFGPVCYSFGESKLLRIGEGGAIATQNHSLCEIIRQARHEGEKWLRIGVSRNEGCSITAKDVISGLASVSRGSNFRPLALAATLGRAMLSNFAELQRAVAANALFLSSALRDQSCLSIPNSDGRTWWTYPVMLKGKKTPKRDVVIAALLAEGIPVGVHFPRVLSDHPVLSRRCRVIGPTFGAHEFADKHFVLPIYSSLGAAHMGYMSSVIIELLSSKLLHGPKAEQRAEEYLANARLRCLSSGLFMFLDRAAG